MLPDKHLVNCSGLLFCTWSNGGRESGLAGEGHLPSTMYIIISVCDWCTEDKVNTLLTTSPAAVSCHSAPHVSPAGK